jgi:hypothetical protein
MSGMRVHPRSEWRRTHFLSETIEDGVCAGPSASNDADGEVGFEPGVDWITL